MGRRILFRRELRWLAAAILAFASLASQARSQSTDPVTEALVRRAAQNELGINRAPGQPFRYKLHKIDDGKINTKMIVETRDGDVARLISLNDKPLTPEEQSDELARLNNLMAHPELQEHRRKREKEDSDRANEMIRLLPDAFVYRQEGTVQGPSGICIRLSFRPNPSFEPPDREAEVYHGMAGELWIDKAQERMVKLDAHLIADVDFGWGILGKLYKGGSILVEQSDVGQHHWETTHMKLNLHGKALLFKSLSFETIEDASDFQPVPKQMSYQDAIRMLMSGPAAAQIAESATPR